jgi:chorismate dehydratase
MTPLTFVSVPYANAVVPTRSIARMAPGTVVRSEVPSRLYDLIVSGAADAALVPVVDFLFGRDLELVDDFGIAADGPVESVLLQCRVPLEHVRTVAMDPASHTSNVLTELLLKEHWKQATTWSDAPDAPDAPDAAVTIGDRALQVQPSGFNRDLSEAWRDMTGLPFVFAVWACRKGHPRRTDMSRILRAALDEGMRNAHALAAEQSAALGLPVERCLRYMTTSIRYRIGEREHRAMRTFESMIRRHGDTLHAMRRTALANP